MRNEENATEAAQAAQAERAMDHALDEAYREVENNLLTVLQLEPFTSKPGARLLLEHRLLLTAHLLLVASRKHARECVSCAQRALCPQGRMLLAKSVAAERTAQTFVNMSDTEWTASRAAFKRAAEANVVLALGGFVGTSESEPQPSVARDVRGASPRDPEPRPGPKRRSPGWRRRS